MSFEKLNKVNTFYRNKLEELIEDAASLNKKNEVIMISY